MFFTIFCLITLLIAIAAYVQTNTQVTIDANIVRAEIAEHKATLAANKPAPKTAFELLNGYPRKI